MGYPNANCSRSDGSILCGPAATPLDGNANKNAGAASHSAIATAAEPIADWLRRNPSPAGRCQEHCWRFGAGWPPLFLRILRAPSPFLIISTRILRPEHGVRLRAEGWRPRARGSRRCRQKRGGRLPRASRGRGMAEDVFPPISASYDKYPTAHSAKGPVRCLCVAFASGVFRQACLFSFWLKPTTHQCTPYGAIMT